MWSMPHLVHCLADLVFECNHWVKVHTFHLLYPSTHTGVVTSMSFSRGYIVGGGFRVIHATRLCQVIFKLTSIIIELECHKYCTWDLG